MGDLKPDIHNFYLRAWTQENFVRKTSNNINILICHIKVWA